MFIRKWRTSSSEERYTFISIPELKDKNEKKKSRQTKFTIYVKTKELSSNQINTVMPAGSRVR